MTDTPIRTHEALPPVISSKMAEQDTGCWMWTAAVSADGYGSIKWQGDTWRAHRLTYELLVGPIPDGLHIDHLCRNTLCVNPAHLEPVTPRTNTLRGTNRAAANARKTHCERGHELVGTNLIPRPNGHRTCRTCKQASDAAAYERKKIRRLR